MFWKALLNLSIEFGPVVAFVILVDTINFFSATFIFVILTIVALIAAWIDRGTLAPFPIVAAVSIVSFGLLTVYLQDPFFIIIKDTLYNLACACASAISLYLRRPLLKPLFGDVFAMTDLGWTILTRRWMYMFLLLAGMNEVVRYMYDEKDWALYKIISTILTAVFGFYQFTLSSKHRLLDATPWGMRIKNK
jgi:intracellular septation protein